MTKPEIEKLAEEMHICIGEGCHVCATFKAGYLEGRQDALRECVDLIVEHKNYHVDMVEDGYNNYANLIELCGSFIEEIQNLMQQFNNNEG